VGEPLKRKWLLEMKERIISLDNSNAPVFAPLSRIFCFVQIDQNCIAVFVAVSAMRKDSIALLSSITLTTELSRIQFH